MSIDSTGSSNSSQLSRRTFLGAAGVGASAAVLGGVTRVEAETYDRGLRAQEIRTDVIVVGGGMGGLTSAVRAARAGARVIVLEKAAQPGGTMRESAGGVWTYGSYEQIRNDVPEGDPALQKALFDTLPKAYAFYEEIGAPIGGSTNAVLPMSRTIAPVAFTNVLIADLEEHGGRVMVETAMIRLLVNREQEVIGVLAEGPSGPVYLFSRAVILATGGWAGNSQMVQANITRQFGSVYQRNCGYNHLQPYLTGDGLIAATEIGAAVSEGGFDSFYGHLLPARPARFTHPLVNYSMYHGQYCVVLNLDGRRFTDEAAGRFSSRKLEAGYGEQLVNQEVARQRDATAVYVWDHHINQTQAVEGVQVLGSIDKIKAFKDAGAPVAIADTIEDLARQMEGWNRGLSADVVLRELEQYNEAARNGRTHMLDVPKRSKDHALPLINPPYYAAMGQTGLTGPMGGLQVDPEGRVLSRGGRPIPGLFASGIDIGNIGNYVYMGFLCYGASFGYITGPLAAAQPEPKGGWEIAFS